MDYNSPKIDARSILSFDDNPPARYLRDDDDNRSNKKNRDNNRNDRDYHDRDNSNYDDRDRRDNRNDNRNNKNYQNRNDRDNRDNRDNRNRDRDNRDSNNNNNGGFGNNPICKYLKNGSGTRDEMLNALVKRNGLVKMIEDLNNWNPNKANGARTPQYVYTAVRDIVFASALPEAIEKILDNEELSKKDFAPLMSEILMFLNDSYNKHNDRKYDSESIASMRKAYTNILYKLNKKKVKKFKEIDGISEAFAKQLVILTAGKNVSTSIYPLLRFFYREAQYRDHDVTLSYKLIKKILIAAYGKENIPEVTKYIMLERSRNFKEANDAENVWVMIDMVMRDNLEAMDKKVAENTILTYVKDRRSQEYNNNVIPRRLGDRRTINPDDYPRLTKVFENLEDRDISVIPYLRANLV